MNLVRLIDGVIEPEPEPADDDESDTNSSTSSLGSPCRPRRSSGIASGEKIEAGSFDIGDFINAVGPAVGDCKAGSVSCLVLADLSKTFSLNWLSGVGATSSIYCCSRAQQRASSVRPLIIATYRSACAVLLSDMTHLSIPGAQLFRRLTFNLVMIRQICKLVIIKDR